MFKHTQFLASLFILTILLGCGNSEGWVKASLNKEFSLATGQTAELQEGNNLL